MDKTFVVGIAESSNDSGISDGSFDVGIAESPEEVELNKTFVVEKSENKLEKTFIIIKE